MSIRQSEQSSSEQQVNSGFSNEHGLPSAEDYGLNVWGVDPNVGVAQETGQINYLWGQSHYRDMEWYNDYIRSFFTIPSFIETRPTITMVPSEDNIEDNTEMPKKKVEEKVEMFRCSCGVDVKVTNKVILDGKDYCGTCVKKCCDCKNPHKVENSRYIKFGSYDWKYICLKCLEKYTKCHDCGVMFEDKDGFVNTRNDIICSACDENYIECSDCGSIAHSNYIDEERCCDACRALAHHDYKPDPIFYNKEGIIKTPKKTDIYYGVELEVETIEGDIKSTCESIKKLFAKNFVYCKEDGSLDRGIEIVTHPASVDAHKDNWVKFFKQRPDNIRSFDTTTCGLHVHATRKPLSNPQISKIVCFVSEENNRNFITKLAQRGSTEFCKIKPKKISTAWKNKSIEGFEEERYCAVNLCNKSTIEFRIFKGTLKQESFFKAIEFCEALIEFCGTAKRRIKECLDHKKFIDFVLAEPKAKIKSKKIVDINGKKVKKPEFIPPFEHKWPHLATFCKLYLDTQLEIPVNIRDLTRTEDIPDNVADRVSSDTVSPVDSPF